MSSTLLMPIPIETASAALALYGISHYCLAIGDRANILFAGLAQEDSPGQYRSLSRETAILSLITIFQCIEMMPDHLAVEAVRKRVDWKYALHLSVNESPHLEAGTLCEFRRGLLADPNRQKNFETLLARLPAVTQFAEKQRFCPSSSQVVIRICRISRIAMILETFSRTLEALATARPDWLLANSLPHWYQRYDPNRRNLNLSAEPPEQERIAQSVGNDGAYLLNVIATAAPPTFDHLPEVKALKKVWQEQYEQSAGTVLWRKSACAGCQLET